MKLAETYSQSGIKKYWYNHDSGKLHEIPIKVDGKYWHHIDFAHAYPKKLHLDADQKFDNDTEWRQHNAQREYEPLVPHLSVLRNNTRITQVGDHYIELNHPSIHPRNLEHSQDILMKLNMPQTADVTHMFGSGGASVASTVMDTMCAKNFHQLDFSGQLRAYRGESREKVSMPRDEFEREHERLVRVLRSGTKREREREATGQERELQTESYATLQVAAGRDPFEVLESFVTSTHLA